MSACLELVVGRGWRWVDWVAACGEALRRSLPLYIVTASADGKDRAETVAQAQTHFKLENALYQ